MNDSNKKSQSDSSQQGQVEKKMTTNQKKKTIKRKNKCRNLFEKFGDTYISTIILPTKKDDEYECKVCPKGTLFNYKSIKRHILESETHANKVPRKDKEAHDNLVEKIRSSMKMKESKKLSDQNNQNSKGYLEFLALCMKARCSFKQISEIGNGLKKMQKENNLKFIEEHAFTEEEISHVARCFGECLLEELKEQLSTNKYSLCIDNSTLTGKGISIIEARYLKTKIENDLSITQIKNKVVGVKYLSESSDGETMYKIVREKVLDLSPSIGNNLVGLAHDMASSLTGENIGLIDYIRENYSEK